MPTLRVLFMLKQLCVAVLFVITGTARAGIPHFNVSCPGNLYVHADKGGAIYINGKETKLKKINANYYEATGAGVTLSIAINPDGSILVSYTGKHGIHGICE